MKKIGDLGEIKAIEYLKSKGYRIITTNYKFGRIGEIDIVASKNDFTVFVEVKTRTSESYGTPLESITFSKKEKIYKTILSYMETHGIDEEMIRFDVISIFNDEITHFEGCELGF